MWRELSAMKADSDREVAALGIEMSHCGHDRRDLIAEIERLRAALELIAAAPGAIGETTLSKSGTLVSSYKSEQIARDALAPEKEPQP